MRNTFRIFYGLVGWAMLAVMLTFLACFAVSLLGIGYQKYGLVNGVVAPLALAGAILCWVLAGLWLLEHGSDTNVDLHDAIAADSATRDKQYRD